MYQLTQPVSPEFALVAGVALCCLVLGMIVESAMSGSTLKACLRVLLWSLAISCTVLTVLMKPQIINPVQAKVLSVYVEGREEPVVMAKLQTGNEVFFLEIPQGFPVGKTVNVYKGRSLKFRIGGGVASMDFSQFRHLLR